MLPHFSPMLPHFRMFLISSSSFLCLIATLHDKPSPWDPLHGDKDNHPKLFIQSRENTAGSTEPVINNQPHNIVDVRQLCGGPLSCRWRLLSLVWIRIIWCRSKVETAPPRHPFHCNDAESRPGDSWKQRLLPRNLKSPGHESSPFRGSNLASSANSANSTCFCHSANKRWVVVEATSGQSNKKQEESFLAWHLYFWRYEAAGPQHSRTWLWQEGTWQSIMTGKRHYKRHHFVFSAVLVNLE